MFAGHESINLRAMSIISRESFDYTEWQQTLWQDKSVDEVFAMARKHSEEIGQEAKPA